MERLSRRNNTIGINDNSFIVMFEVIQSVLFSKDFPPYAFNDSNEIISMLKNHGMLLFLDKYINDVPRDKTNIKEYKRIILNQNLQLVRINAVTDDITHLFQTSGIACAVIKGSAAAMYYPDPHLRAAGDIDLLVKAEDMVKAHDLIIGYGFNGPENVSHGAKHVEYMQGAVEIELHSSVSRILDKAKNEYLNGIILGGMEKLERKQLDSRAFYSLPALQNGLVLLQHVFFHLQHGLGLRQIVDWMMFVHNSGMKDWEEFNRISKYTGLFTLQQVMTKLCINYLGLPDRDDLVWCQEASDELCEQLLTYICSKGNFGASRSKDDFASQFILAKDLKTGFRGLQNRGLKDWNAAKRYPVLRPFAWMYQLTRYAKGLASKGNFARSLNRNMAEVKANKEMLRKLGIE